MVNEAVLPESRPSRTAFWPRESVGTEAGR